MSNPQAASAARSDVSATGSTRVTQAIVQPPLRAIADCFEGMPSISLERTNRLAKMLNRIDNKYVVDLKQFDSLLRQIRDRYLVLTINDINQFTYRSCYYDDDFGCYLEHHQGRRQRVKVRTREYVDSGSRFFEIKLKGKRGLTNKHRTESDFLVAPKIKGRYLALLQQVYEKQYKKPMKFELFPALMVGYKRCTLVAEQGAERVTIDYGLQFELPKRNTAPVRIGEDFIIVETKSRDGKGLCDTALKALKIRKASKCSKYCIGANLTGQVSRNNYFLPNIRRAQRNIRSSSSDRFGATIAECAG